MINNEYVSKYLQKMSKNKRRWLLDLEEYAKLNKVPIIQKEVATFLEVQTALVKPKRILEIGTAIGYSAIIMSEFLQEDGKIDTIEISYDMATIAKENIKRFGLENKIDVIFGDATEVLQCFNKEYDMIFMDASKGQYIVFFNECMRMLKRGGLLISDNVLYKGMIANDKLILRRKKTIVSNLRKYLDILMTDERLKSTIVPIGDGMALSYRINNECRLGRENE